MLPSIVNTSVLVYVLYEVEFCMSLRHERPTPRHYSTKNTYLLKIKTYLLFSGMLRSCFIKRGRRRTSGYWVVWSVCYSGVKPAVVFNAIGLGASFPEDGSRARFRNVEF